MEFITNSLMGLNTHEHTCNLNLCSMLHIHLLGFSLSCGTLRFYVLTCLFVKINKQ